MYAPDIIYIYSYILKEEREKKHRNRLFSPYDGGPFWVHARVLKWHTYMCLHPEEGKKEKWGGGGGVIGTDMNEIMFVCGHFFGLREYM